MVMPIPQCAQCQQVGGGGKQRANHKHWQYSKTEFVWIQRVKQRTAAFPDQPRKPHEGDARMVRLVRFRKSARLKTLDETYYAFAPEVVHVHIHHRVDVGAAKRETQGNQAHYAQGNRQASLTIQSVLPFVNNLLKRENRGVSAAKDCRCDQVFLQFGCPIAQASRSVSN